LCREVYGSSKKQERRKDEKERKTLHRIELFGMFNESKCRRKVQILLNID
jgi:hypothetical protein